MTNQYSRFWLIKLLLLLCLSVARPGAAQASSARTVSTAQPVHLSISKYKIVRNLLKRKIWGKTAGSKGCTTLVLKDSTELPVIIKKRRGNRIWYTPCYESDKSVRTLDRRDLIAARLPDGRLWTRHERWPPFGNAAPESVAAFILSLASVFAFIWAINVYLEWLIIISPILAIAALALGWSGFRKSPTRRFWSAIAMSISIGMLGLYAWALLELLFYF